MLAQTLVPEDRSVSSAAASSSALTTPPLPSGAEQPGDLGFLNSVLSEEAGSEAEGHRRAEDAPSPGPSPPEPPPPSRAAHDSANNDAASSWIERLLPHTAQGADLPQVPRALQGAERADAPSTRAVSRRGNRAALWCY